MHATLERPSMANKGGRPKTSTRDDVTVKVSRRIVGKAKLLAAHRGVSIAELFSEMLEGPVDRGYIAMLKELEKRQAEEDA